MKEVQVTLMFPIIVIKVLLLKIFDEINTYSFTYLLTYLLNSVKKYGEKP